MNIAQSNNRVWLSMGLLGVMVWFPPAGILGLFFGLKAVSEYRSGNKVSAARNTLEMRRWLRLGMTGGLVCLVLLAFYVFWEGGDLFPALDSIY